MYVSILDAESEYPEPNDSDTVHSAFVGLNVELWGADTLSYYSYIPTSTFSEARAMEPCPVTFLPSEPVQSVKVFTVYELNSYPSGSDITHEFVAETDYSGPGNFLYTHIDSLPGKINQASYDQEMRSFNLYYKYSVSNDSARFKVQVTLSDKSVLEVASNTIYIEEAGQR
ncbi:MAG: hypothetical protein PF450_13645 [Bacteroidales bacterium]|jgi:hypothetical protein|nr:hypothetical protein [Bacteroidales bacterium]